MSWLINAVQLDKLRKDQKNVVILDASWYLASPNNERDAKAVFKEEHIIGARFFDLDLFSDTHNPLPSMLTRNEKEIAEKMSALGITNENKIIIYDHSPLHSSCRALWMLKVFGHASHHLYLLDGGLHAWKKYGGKLESGETRAIIPRQYTVNYQSHLIRTLMQMKGNLHHQQMQVVDVRHPVRFAGGPETRAGMRSGHIPNSFSFFYMTLFDKEGYLKPLEKIRKQLNGIGVEVEAPIVTSCGSGNTAAILDFVLDLLGNEEHALYDGSWSEWGSNQLYQGEESLAERPVIRSVDE